MIDVRFRFLFSLPHIHTHLFTLEEKHKLSTKKAKKTKEAKNTILKLNGGKILGIDSEESIPPAYVACV